MAIKETMTDQNMRDHYFMYNACAIARHGIGLTAPNPSVGCVIVKDDVIVARAHTALGGRPHAEKIALARAGEKARGATAYVTLEPCSFKGQSGACTQALIDAAIARVVIAQQDIHPEVCGKGIQQLRDAGIEVVLGVGAEEALDGVEGFFSVYNMHRPAVTVKLATSSDGCVFWPKAKLGEMQQQWITQLQARSHGQLLRYTHDAIMVGSQTVLMDNPYLTCRLPGIEPAAQPIRVVLDRRGRVPADAHVITSAAETPTWIIGDNSINVAGVKHVMCDAYDISTILRYLAQQGITRLLVEGGVRLATLCVEAHMVDQIYWYQAPYTIGNEAARVDITAWVDMLGLVCVHEMKLGEDRVMVFRRNGLGS